MSQTLDKLKRKRAAALDDARTTYVRLVERVASTDKLPAADDARFAEAIDALGLDLGAVEADVLAFAKARELAAEAAGLPEAEAAAAAAAERLTTAEADLAAAVTGLTKARNTAAVEAGAGRHAVVAKRRAGGQLAVHRRERSDLFGGPSAAEWSRRAYLIQVVAVPAGPMPEEHDVREFEQVMTNPTVFDPGREYVTAPGQSAAELADLIDRARALVARRNALSTRDGKPNGEFIGGRYLVTRAEAATLAHTANLVLSDGETALTFEPERIAFERMPGQTAEDLAGRVAAYLKRLAKEQRLARDAATVGWDAAEHGVVTRVDHRFVSTGNVPGLARD